MILRILAVSSLFAAACSSDTCSEKTPPAPKALSNMALGDPCHLDADCQSGLSCLHVHGGTGSGTAVNACSHFCDQGNSCSAGESCVPGPFDNTTDAGPYYRPVCLPSCGSDADCL